jgi:Flp pilus assembly protein TadG
MMNSTQRERGQTLVLFALAIVGIVALVGLVVDGGFLYVQRRTAQAAADAGALAGTRALREFWTTQSTATIRDAAITTAQANTFGTTPTVNCVYLVDVNMAPMGLLNTPPAGANCPSQGAASSSSVTGASGVHVDVQITYPSIIAGMLRVSTFSPVAAATAQLGSPSGIYTSDAPLILCGGGASGAAGLVTTTAALTLAQIDAGPGSTPPQYTSVTTYTLSKNNVTLQQILDNSNNIIQGLAGNVYYLKGPLVGQVTSGSWSNDCSAPSNTFDGGAVPDQSVTVPGQLSGMHGNSVAPIGSQVEAPGGCASGVQPGSWTAGSPGCVMILPIANGYLGKDSSNNPILSIPALGAFYVWCNKGDQSGNGCQEYLGQLMPGDAVTGKYVNSVSMGSTGPLTMPVAVRLTQ